MKYKQDEMIRKQDEMIRKQDEMIRKQDEMIRKQDAIKAIDQILEALWEIDIPSPTVPEYIEHHQGVQAVMKRARDLKEILEKLPAVQPEPPWIPCDKGLPDYGYEVLISTYDWVGVAHRVAPMPGSDETKDGWMDSFGEMNEPEDVCAWVPFPQPYEGK